VVSLGTSLKKSDYLPIDLDRLSLKIVKVFAWGFFGLIFVLCLLGVTHRTVYSRQVDPTGKYTAIFSYKTYESLIPGSIGGAGDKPCYIKIVDNNGKNMGEIPVPMIQMAEIEWSTNAAEVKLVGEWDFAKKICYYWSKDGDRQIYVRR
jgi:hypothetical protein